MSAQRLQPAAPSACRLYGLLASEAPLAVLLRRGPTQRVQQILWQTDSDTFAEGQWFYGRIYEWGCDLSPDGQYLLYLARKTKTPARARSRATHKWTALSHPPYFTALTLWPAGESWQGGGVFLSNRALWLCYHRNEIKERRYKQFAIEAGNRPERIEERAQRNGWELLQRGQFAFERIPDNEPGPALRIRGLTHQPEIWRKYTSDRRYCLLKEFYREPNFKIEPLIYLLKMATGTQHAIEETTWIDWDQRGRLVFARAGRLFASRDPEGDPLEVVELADFNANRPTAVIAPYQGIRW